MRFDKVEQAEIRAIAKKVAGSGGGGTGPAGPPGPAGPQGPAGESTFIGNLDGGEPDTNFNGISSIDLGGV